MNTLEAVSEVALTFLVTMIILVYIVDESQQIAIRAGIVAIPFVVIRLTIFLMNR